MSNNKQSSVEKLAELIRFTNKEVYAELFEEIEQIKAMHKEESITYAHDFARQMLQNRRFVTPEIIYNETFGE